MLKIKNVKKVMCVEKLKMIKGENWKKLNMVRQLKNLKYHKTSYKYLKKLKWWKC